MIGCGSDGNGLEPAPIPTSQWLSRGPGGGAITGLATSADEPSVVYASVGPAGVFRSADAGRSWSTASAGLPVLDYSQVFADPGDADVVYAMPAYQGGLFRSLDGGAHWSQLGGLPRSSFGFMAIAPSDPRVLYAAVQGEGLYRSADRGQTWTKVSSEAIYLNALAVHPRDADTLLAGDSGLLRSTDGGAHWQRLDNGFPHFTVSSIVFDPRQPENIYASTWQDESGCGIIKLDTEVYRSTDGGARWTSVGLKDTGIEELAISASEPATLYAATYHGGVFKTEDRGGRWTLVEFNAADPVRTVAIHPTDPSIVYAGSNYSRGILRSSDAGRGFALSNQGLNGTDVRGLAIDPRDPQRLFAAVTDGGLFESRDAGLHWDLLSEGLARDYSPVGVVQLPQDPDTLILLDEVGSLYKSSNGGKRWKLIEGFEFGYRNTVVPDPTRAGTLYAGGYGPPAVIKSLDAGETWSPSEAGLESYVIRAIAIDPQDPQRLYAGGDEEYGRNGRVLYTSANGGSNWTPLHRPAAEVTSVDDVDVDPKDPATIYVCGRDAGVYKSRDHGQSWTQILDGREKFQTYDLDLDPTDPSTLYVAVDGGDLLVSNNGGISFKPHNEGLLMEEDRAASLRFVRVDPSDSTRVYLGTGVQGLLVRRFER